MPTVDVAVAADCALGEAPIWDSDEGCLWWVDILGRRLHRATSAGAHETRDVGGLVGCIALRQGGGLILARDLGVWTYNPLNSAQSLLARIPDPSPGTRWNDGKCDPQGNFWAGTMSLTEVPKQGSLYRIGRDHAVDTKLTAVSVSNGLAWSLDGQTLYYIDSPERRVDSFEFRDGEISSRRVAFEVSGPGVPDGMCIDAEGYLWLAIWDGGEVRRYHPAGSLDMTVKVPATRVTSLTFGGADLDLLFITSAHVGITPTPRRSETHAGSVFVCRPGPVGQQSSRYRG